MSGPSLQIEFTVFMRTHSVVVKTKKIKTLVSIGCIDNPGLLLVELQSHLSHLVLDQFHASFCLFLRSEQNHKVSSAGEFHPCALVEPDVNLSVLPAPIIQPLIR